MKNSIESVGIIEMIINYEDRQEISVFKNTVLLNGRYALARSLANQFQGTFNFYIVEMLFGNGGTQGGSPRYVYSNRDGFFGVTVLSKPVISTIDVSLPQQTIFTTVIKSDEAVGQTLNEMALKMANGLLFSMSTFPDLNKTSQMTITYNWKINFL